MHVQIHSSPLNTKMTLGVGKIQVINADLGNTFPRTVATSENSAGLLCCWAGWWHTYENSIDVELCWSTPVLEIKQTKYLPLSAFFCKLGIGDVRQGNELTVVSCYWANGRGRFRNQSPSFLTFLTEIIAMVGAVAQWHMQEKLVFIFCCLRGMVLHTASVVLFVQGHLHHLL